MKRRLIIPLFLLIFTLASCKNPVESINDATGDEVDEEILELIEEYNGNREATESASVTATHLIITDENEEETVYPMPEDNFFVSIAPYKERTHPCTNHSLTGCQGELFEEEFEIYIEESEGNIIVQDQLRTEANGFIDLWLPRNETFHVTNKQKRKVAKETIITFDDRSTCITTMYLT